jgi:hypothetical protein
VSHAAEFLAHIAVNLRKQNNEYTASPIYCIQERVLVVSHIDLTQSVGVISR